MSTSTTRVNGRCPVMTDQLTLDIAARDRVLQKHQRRELVRWLEYACYLETLFLGGGDYAEVSVNTCRRLLRPYVLPEFDHRLFGGVFPPSRWVQVGEVISDSGKCHARKIRLFEPRPEAVGYFDTRIARPAWLVEETE